MKYICLFVYLFLSSHLFAQKTMEDYNDGKLTTVEVFLNWVNDNYDNYNVDSPKNRFKYIFGSKEQQKLFLNIAKNAGFTVESSGTLLNGAYHTKLTRKNKGYYDYLNLFVNREAVSQGILTTFKEVYSVEYDREITDLENYDESYAKYIKVIKTPENISGDSYIQYMADSIFVNNRYFNEDCFFTVETIIDHEAQVVSALFHNGYRDRSSLASTIADKISKVIKKQITQGKITQTSYTDPDGKFTCKKPLKITTTVIIKSHKVTYDLVLKKKIWQPKDKNITVPESYVLPLQKLADEQFQENYEKRQTVEMYVVNFNNYEWYYSIHGDRLSTKE